MTRQHLSFRWSRNLFTPVPPSGSKVTCTAVENESLESYFYLSVLIQGGVLTDNVLGLYHFGGLCAVKDCLPLFSLKCASVFLKAWTADRADCHPQWHCCHPYFLFPRLSLDPLTLSLKVCCYDNSVSLRRWSIQYVWRSEICVNVHGCRQAARQLSLLNPLIATRGGWTGMNKLTTDCVCC